MALREAEGASANRVARFCECGASAAFWFSPSEKRFKIVAAYCRDRFCLPCGKARSRTIADNLNKYCEGLFVRFVTLTLRSFGDSLGATLNRLISSFRRLRESFAWKTAVKGGAALVEVKRGSRSGGWHVHLHMLTHGRFLDQKTLSDAWQRASGDSYIVDIRAVGESRKAVNYVAKYASFPLDPSVFRSQADLVTCVNELKGRRLLWTFGDWRGLPLEEQADGPKDWQDVGPMDAIIRMAEGGDGRAIDVLAAAKRSIEFSNENSEGIESS